MKIASGNDFFLKNTVNKSDSKPTNLFVEYQRIVGGRIQLSR
jgi:hypothetical protein